MNTPRPPDAAGDARLAIEAFACAPRALGALTLRGPADPPRDAMLKALRAALPAAAPWIRMPVHVGDDALHGAPDLAATLAAGRLVVERGLFARAAGGLLVAASAERIGAVLAAKVAAALDGDAGFGLVLLDEGVDDEALPPSLAERVALTVRPVASALPDPARIERACATWRDVRVADERIEAIAAVAQALGVGSARATWQALCVTRIAAALEGRAEATDDDVARAARVVLAPKATRLPPGEESPEPPAEAAPDEPPEPPRPADESPEDATARTDDDRPLEDRVLDAAQAAIPAGLLALLAAGRTRASRGGDAGREGAMTASLQRGRSIGSRRGTPRGGARLALIDTLRAAAPWQNLRRQASGDATRVHVSREDLRVQRRVQQRATTTIFAIDASGSQAMHRLAEAKGAVELLLADCYARRDRVAVIAFRGRDAQVLLAPTRSLVRAKRQLAGLPGGGGTPLAAGLAAAQDMAQAVRRGGATPLVVLLTDGRANVSRDGTGGREAAQRDMLIAARHFAASATPALLIDTSAQPGAAAPALAAALGARCVALPYAQAHALSQAVRDERSGTGAAPRRG